MNNRVKRERRIEKLLGLPLNIITLGYYSCVEVSAHHAMTRERIQRCCKVSFRQFNEAFEKVDWETSRGRNASLFGRYDGPYSVEKFYRNIFHASIVSINGVGCLFTTIGLIRAKMLVKKKVRELNGADECGCCDDALLFQS